MHFSQVLICLASSSSGFIQTFILHGQKQLREEGELPGTHQLSRPARTLTAEAPQPDTSWQNHSFFLTSIFCVTCYIYRMKFFTRCTPFPSCSSPLFLLFNGPHRFWQLVRPAGLCSTLSVSSGGRDPHRRLETEGLVGKALLFLLPSPSRQDG